MCTMHHDAINRAPWPINFRNYVVKVRHNKADAHAALTCALNCNLTLSCPSQAKVPTEEEEREDIRVFLPLPLMLEHVEITAYASS